MKRFIICVLVFFIAKVVAAQTKTATDSSIVNTYSETVYEKFPDGSTSNPFLLVRIKEAFSKDFKREFQRYIKREIVSNWFIISSKALNEKKLKEFSDKIFRANNNWKFSPNLLDQKGISPDKQYTFLLETDNEALFTSFVHKYANYISIIAKSRNTFIVKTNLSFVNSEILNKLFITSVQIRVSGAKEESVINDYDNSENAINLFFAKYPLINGNGLCASLKENFFDTSDIDFKGRFTQTNLNSNLVTSHATTMATFIGGGGNSFITGKGIAWGSNLASSDFAVLLPDADSVYNNHNITIQNHSYGVGVENFYGSDAADYDASMLSNPSLLHIFSSGNSGDITPADGKYAGIPGFSNLTGSFKMAKNIITVGSLDSFYNVPLLSSKGPAYDGRIKPDLVAYGNDGSSGAAAITSGTALAVQSAFAQQHNSKLPDNALVKAILINSADDILTPGPDYTSGYGSVNTYKAVHDILSGNYFHDSVMQGQTKDFVISVPQNSKNIKITLVWTDEPALPNSFTALVNDLDLTLERNSNQNTWLPWVLNSSSNIDSIKQLPKRSKDSLNVVEQITVQTLSGGDYTIHVNGYNLITNQQSFYVAYRWDAADSFYFISPAKKDHFTSGDNSIFRWNSTYQNATGKLEYTTDGSTWKLINNNVDLSKKYLKWITPDTFSLAKVRMTIGADVYTSDTFNFSKQLFPEVGFNCADSVLITWNKIKGIDQYQVYNLGDKYLQPFSITRDTSIVINTNAASSPFISVTTIFNQQNTGVNSYAFDYTTQGVGCYISNFLADINTNNNASLQLELGTTYNISSVTFQSLAPTGWQDIATIQPITTTTVLYEDATMHAGINTYRAAVKLNSGAIIYSAIASVNYFDKNNFIVFPNPVKHTEYLNVLSNNFLTNIFTLYDVAGKKVLEQEIKNTSNQVSVSHLAKGIYFIIIYNDKQKVYTGKLLVQ